MNSEKNELFDVLSILEEQENQPDGDTIQNPYTQHSEPQETELVIVDDSHLFFENKKQEETIEEDTKAPIKKETPKKKPSILSTGVFLIKYLSTSTLIFVVLLFTTNYSAYYNIAMSTLFQKDFERQSESLLSSVEASSIDHTSDEAESDIPSLESATVAKKEAPFNSIETLAAQAKRAEVDLDITITPYENRIVIPKIGKNIPLIDIVQKKVTGIDELNDIFMKELEKGVIRYPGSAKPGEDGNAFVFGHSSNFPWMEGDYNDVFSLLDKVVYDDEIVVYYGQEKYVYKIRTKEVIRPGDVSVLKKNEGRSQITLMTCWPIGTTLNRLILVGELVEIK